MGTVQCEKCCDTGLWTPPWPQDQLWGIDPTCPDCGNSDSISDTNESENTYE